MNIHLFEHPIKTFYLIVYLEYEYKTVEKHSYPKKNWFIENGWTSLTRQTRKAFVFADETGRERKNVYLYSCVFQSSEIRFQILTTHCSLNTKPISLHPKTYVDPFNTV